MRVITCVYGNVIHKYKVTRESHKSTSFTSVHSFQVFVRVNLKMRNILLGVTASTLGFHGVMFTNVALLLSCNAHDGISSLSLPFIPIFSGPYSMP